MRILHALPSASEGGMQRCVSALAHEMRGLGCEVGVASPAGPLDGIFGAPTFIAPSTVSGFQGLRCTWLWYRRLLRSWRPDVIVGHSTRMAPVISRIVTLGTSDASRMTVIHGVPDEALARCASVLRLCRTDVVAVGPDLGRRLQERGIACRVIENGIDVKPVITGTADVGKVRRLLGIPEEAPLLSTVGRLVPQKNHILAIRALPRMPEAYLAIVGEGPLEAELGQLAEDLGVAQRLRLAGFRPDALEIVAASDVVLMPSHWEGLSIAALEALASGTPLIVSPGWSGWLRDEVNCLVVNQEDSEGLAAAVLRVLGNGRLRQQLVEGGLAVAREHSIRETALQYIELMSELRCTRGSELHRR